MTQLKKIVEGHMYVCFHKNIIREYPGHPDIIREVTFSLFAKSSGLADADKTNDACYYDGRNNHCV